MPNSFSASALLLMLLHQVLWRPARGAAALIDGLRAGLPTPGMRARTHPLCAWLANP